MILNILKMVDMRKNYYKIIIFSHKAIFLCYYIKYIGDYLFL